MSNMQFYFAMGVPFFTVVLMFIVATISNRSAINDLGKRIDDLGKRMDDLGAGLNKRMDDLGAGLNKRMDDFRMDVTGRLERIEKKLSEVEITVRQNHESRLAVLESKVFSKAG